MREPLIHITQVWDDGRSERAAYPYSAATIEDLRAVIAGEVGDEYPDNPTDFDFHRRYAAILLRERGQ